MLKKSEYDIQAETFAENCKLTMSAVYLGHYPRLHKNYITANYRITLTRPGMVPFGFDFSTSINDSWTYGEGITKMKQGLPPRINMEKFFESYLQKPIREAAGFIIEQCKKAPSLYDVLACLTKSDPGTFDNFCSEYGYNNDSISAMQTWQAVTEEYKNVKRLFSDVMEELQEIN